MPVLLNAKIFRGGGSSKALTHEETGVVCNVNSRREDLDLEFQIRSKGGGKTAIKLRLDKHDLTHLINDIVAHISCLHPVLFDALKESHLEKIRTIDQCRERGAEGDALLEDIDSRITNLWIKTIYNEDEIFHSELGELGTALKKFGNILHKLKLDV